jgi:hypothetical protein
MSGEGAPVGKSGGTSETVLHGGGVVAEVEAKKNGAAAANRPDQLVGARVKSASNRPAPGAVPAPPGEEAGKMTPVPAPGHAKGASLEPVLAAGLARERRYVSLLADPELRPDVGYTVATPSRAEVDHGRTNCSTFVEAVLRDAGYDVDAELTVGGASVSVHDLINIRAESATQSDGQRLRAVVPEVLAAGKDAARTLAELVAARDPRTQGVAWALVESRQGTAVTRMAELRPGDAVQTWKLVRNEQGELVRARGHSTFVRRVHAVDLDTGKAVILDETTPATSRRLQVTAVELFGSHFPDGSKADASGFRPGRSVYTKPAVSLDAEFDPWYAVRPARSPWTAPS